MQSLEQNTAACSVRLADKDEGALIRQLFVLGGRPDYDWIDWSNVYPYWLIGEIDGEPMGCIMSVPGRPFGRADYLTLVPGLSHRQKAVLARDLCYAAIESCKQFGSQAVLSTVSYTDEAWEQIAVKRGWKPIDWGTFLLKRT